jgi:hypothetical protein
MADAGARAAVAALKALGLTDTGIGRALGRDSSLISQIGAGKRGPGYGASYAGELRDLIAQTAGLGRGEARARAADLAERGTLAPARRVTRAGTPAAVRVGQQRVGRAPSTPGGHAGHYVKGRAAGRATFDRRLDTAVNNGQEIALKVTVADARSRKGTRDVYVGQMTAAELQGRLDATGRRGLKAQLQALLDDMSDAGELGSDGGAVLGYGLSVLAS